MTDPIKTLKQNEKLLKIYIDEYPEDPRQWDNLGKFVLSHKRYNLPNEINFNFNSFEVKEIDQELRKNHDAEVILFVYGYDHSGLSISIKRSYPFNDAWDSGVLGFIIAKKEDIKKEFNVKRITEDIKQKVYKILEDEVKTYNQYLNGEIYSYQLFKINKPKFCKCCKKQINETEELIDSCSGFYDIKEILEDLKFKDE